MNTNMFAGGNLILTKFSLCNVLKDYLLKQPGNKKQKRVAIAKVVVVADANACNIKRSSGKSQMKFKKFFLF